MAGIATKKQTVAGRTRAGCGSGKKAGKGLARKQCIGLLIECQMGPKFALPMMYSSRAKLPYTHIHTALIVPSNPSTLINKLIHRAAMEPPIYPSYFYSHTRTYSYIQAYARTHARTHISTLAHAHTHTPTHKHPPFSGKSVHTSACITKKASGESRRMKSR